MKINNILSKNAYNNFKTLPFVHEFRMIIIVFICLRLITMFISGFASFDWYYFNLIQHLQNELFTAIAAIFLSVLIEFAVTGFFYKFFKFLFKARIVYAVMCFIGASIFISIAFIATTNGLASKQYAKHDKTTLFIENSKLENDNLKKENNLKITELKKEIELIKLNPSGWIGGKRSVLTPEQLQTIKEYNEQIFKLQSEQRNDIERKEKELKSNIEKTQNIAKIEAEKFYNIGIGIIFFQIVTALGIAFFHSKIYNEIASDDEKNDEQTKSLFDVVNTFVDIMTKNVLTSKFTHIASKLQHISENYQPQIIELPVNNVKFINSVQEQILESKENELKETEKPTIKGFQKTKETNELINNNLSSVKDKHSLMQPKNCLTCGKVYKPYNIIQKYCSFECNAIAYEKRTGKKLRVKNLKKKNK